MSLYMSSLRTEMGKYKLNRHKLAVLVIDEQSEKGLSNIVVDDQRAVLSHAIELEIPILRVELNPTIINKKPAPNLPTAEALGAGEFPVISKPHLNAFDSRAEPNLHGILQKNNIDTLVVMGYHVNCCIRATCVGGFDGSNRSGTVRPGATQLGYIVLASSKICRPTDEHATWFNEPSVKFFMDI